MARTARTALILGLGALLLAGCGRKGPLEPPGGVPSTQSEPGEAKPERPVPANEKPDEADPAERVLETPHKP